MVWHDAVHVHVLKCDSTVFSLATAHMGTCTKIGGENLPVGGAGIVYLLPCKLPPQIPAMLIQTAMGPTESTCIKHCFACASLLT